MKEYNFEEDKGQFEETKRLDDINQEIKKMVQKKEDSTLPPEDDLGDSDAFLENFHTEQIEKEEQTIPEEQGVSLEEEERRQRRLKLQLSLGAIFCILVFILGFALVRGGMKRQNAAPLEAEASEQMQDALFLVRQVDAQGILSIHSILEEKNYQIQTDKNTKFLDRDGKPVTLQAIACGDIVEVIFEPDTTVARSVKLSQETWLNTQVTGLVVDTDEKILTINTEDGDTKRFAYTAETLFVWKENQIMPQDISPVDVVEIQGKDNQIWSLRVLESHGYLTLQHTENVQNGMLQLDAEEPVPLQTWQRTSVVEGSHDIVVTGDNIEPRKETFFVLAEEEKEIDLSKVQTKTGVLILQCPIADYKLYINGEEMDGSEPIVLPMGNEYDIVILAKGYHQWNEKITLDQASYTIPVELEPEILKGTVEILSVPSGALVYIDNEQIGTTPIQKELEYGTYNMMVEQEGYEISNEVIAVGKPSDTITFNLKELEEN